MPPRPLRGSQEKPSVDRTCETPPLTPTSARPTNPHANPKPLPTPVSSLPNPSQPNQNTSSTPPVPVKPSRPLPEMESKPAVPMKPVPPAKPTPTKLKEDPIANIRNSGGSANSSPSQKRVSVRNPGLENV
eukprot:CAMPEP_0117074958 /NCGR_PEP_ID=MMETSP0472-20121206/52841_1 /TAXON_ID=693140 ORGANISM="Tiarina fusus, Strain LIS" /NCGR_SAMPLE_ID=MMETSP0472 /ASSEMBLY_ACC=CAM_ASM_000603 /LENGTH=130 /DNA_ID=CAMNT_0004800253 /DNA_START=218 /DNA_END=607 /DNA_ORIENTATION=-